jgi:hypothetical protein
MDGGKNVVLSFESVVFPPVIRRCFCAQGLGSYWQGLADAILYQNSGQL